MKVTSSKQTQNSIITRLVVSSEAEGEMLADAMYKVSGRVATVERHNHMLDGKWFLQFFSDEIEII